MLPFLIIVFNSIEGGVIIGLKDGDTSRDVPLSKIPIDGVGLNGSSVRRSVELPIGLVCLKIDLGQLRDWNGGMIPRHLQEKALTPIVGLQ